MRNALLLTLNTLKVTFRRKGNIIVFFALPIIGILVSMSIYGNSGSSSMSLGVIDKDKSVISSDMVSSLSKGDKFKVTAVAENEIDSSITSEKVDCVLVIPRGFADGIYNGNTKQVEVTSIKGEAATAWIENYCNIYLKNLSDIAEASGGKKEVFDKIYDNFKQEKLSLKVNTVQDQTKSKDMTTQSIGFLIMFMMLGVGNSAELILKEKRSRTYYRICSAPVNARTYILGNVLANLIIVIIQVLLTLFLLTNVFGIETHIPFMQLFMILVLFGIATIGLGLMIVAFSKDTMQAGTLQNLIITPTCMLAGCFWPVDIMPKAIQKISDFLPQKWVIDAVQKLQEGSGLNQVVMNFSIILGFALAFFLIAAYKFSRNDSVKTFI